MKRAGPGQYPSNSSVHTPPSERWISSSDSRQFDWMNPGRSGLIDERVSDPPERLAPELGIVSAGPPLPRRSARIEHEAPDAFDLGVRGLASKRARDRRGIDSVSP